MSIPENELKPENSRGNLDKILQVMSNSIGIIKVLVKDSSDT